MKNLRHAGALLTAFVLLCGAFLTVRAQTNPTPFDLTTGNFSFAAWPAASTAGTFPANMAFHRSATQDPGLAIDMTTDYVGTYNGTSGARINGLDANGVSFVNTSSSGNIGAAVAAVNTLGRANVKVTFTCQLLAQGDGNPTPREYAIRLQYRVGTTGTWTDAPGPAEYSSAGKAVNHVQTIGPIDLPIAVNNQAVVQLRWKFYSAAANSGGTRPSIRLDDISVTSVSTLGIPAAFGISSITPQSPSTTSTFAATVQSLDASGNPASVTQNTSFSLSVGAGTGVLGGTLTGTILAGNASVVIAGMTYNVAEANVRIAATRTSGDALATGMSAPFTVGAGATGQAFVGLQAIANVGKILRTFTVEARRPNGTVDASYLGNVTIAVATGGGSIAGTLSRPLINGVATFTDITFATAGTFTLSATTSGLSQGISGAVVVSPAIAMTPISVPQYFKSTSDATRVPSYALMRFDNLLPNTSYRYYTSACSTATEAGAGAGNNIHYQEETGTFYTSSSKSHVSINVPPDYSSFTTGAGQTTKTLWVNLVPTGNARFTEGQNIYWRVLLTDAPGFPCDTLTAVATPSRTLEFGQFTNNATGIYDSISGMQPKNYVVFYDNESGSGNPITTAMVQSAGVTIRTGTTTGPAPYYEQLEMLNGSWATLIPNTLPAGIRRIEERTANGSLVRYWSDADGNWAGVNTVNRFSGLTPAINFKTPQITLLTPTSGISLCAGSTSSITWSSRGVQSMQIELFKGAEVPMQIGQNVNGFAQNFSWSIDNITDSSRRYQLRLIDAEHQTATATSAQFSIYLPPEIISEPGSVNTCVGDNIRLVLRAKGTGLTYQWQKDGADIIGATDTTLFLNNSSTLTSGLYRCIVRGLSPCAIAISRIATVFVTPPIQILKQPEFKPAAIGSKVELTVEVMGTENHTYQWRRGTQPVLNSSRISGATTPTLTIHNFQPGDVGSNYNCVISGSLPCGTAITETGGFRASAVQFSVQPDTNTKGCVGGVAQFRATATSTPAGATLEYQWLHNGKMLSNGIKYQGATSAVLTINNVVAADTGLYWVQVSGPGNAAVTSRQVSLTVGAGAKIQMQPLPAILCPGDRTILKVAASGIGAMTYQWYADNRQITGATADTLNITAVRDADTIMTVKNYRCVAKTSCGADTSMTATITVYDKPAITEQPEKKLSLKVGGGIYLSVRFRALHPVKFQWFRKDARKDSAVLGGESAELRISNITMKDSGQYRCAIIGACDTVYSDYANVEISRSTGVTETENLGYYIVGSLPNPASETTTLRFGIGSEANVRITLMDMTGRVMTERMLGLLPNGEHTATLDVSELPSGVYFCAIEAAGIKRFARISVVK